MTPRELSARLLQFSVRIGKFIETLPDTRLGRHVAGQVVRCGTAGGPNYEEACAAESKDDVVHKLAIVLKELRETCYWLRSSAEADLLPGHATKELLIECGELCDIIGKSIATAKSNRT